jgi:hypothetical protein
VNEEPTHEELADLFSDFGIAVYKEDTLPATIVDISARRALSEMGLPLMVSNSLMFDPRERHLNGLEILGEMYQNKCPPEIGELFLLGVWRDSFIALNGNQGGVFLVRNTSIIGRLTSDLPTFITFVYLAQKAVNEGGDEDDDSLMDNLITRFTSIDPTVANSAEIWSEIIKSMRYDD